MSDEPDNVVILDCNTKLDIPSGRVLRGALDKGMSGVVICGWDAEEKEYFASSIADGTQVLWLLERCKQKLMGGLDE